MKARALLVALVCVALPSRADDALDRCLAAHERGQRDALDGKLTRAIEGYRVCAEASCPKLLRGDCKRRLEQAEADVPTLAIEIEGAARHEVEIAIDDADPVALGSEPLSVDPGKRRLRFSTADGRTAERTIEVAAGQRNVRLSVRLEAEPAPETPKAPAPAEPVSASSPSTLVWVLGGVAVIGIGGFIGFGLAGRSKQAELEECKGSCTDPSVYDDMQRNYLIADVSLGVGLVSAALATYIHLNGSKTGPRVGVAPTKAGGVLTWGAAF